MSKTQEPVTDFDIMLAMQTYGGSFAAALGRLFALADGDNQKRLREAFPELWAHYATLARPANGRRTADG